MKKKIWVLLLFVVFLVVLLVCGNGKESEDGGNVLYVGVMG